MTLACIALVYFAAWIAVWAIHMLTRKYVFRPIFLAHCRFCQSSTSCGGYSAVTLFPFVFFKEGQCDDATRRHEGVHFDQQIALGVFPFYLLYVAFWLLRDWNRNPFEREALVAETMPRNSISLRRRMRFSRSSSNRA